MTDHKRLSDAELLSQLRSGSRIAFTEIFERYRNLLFSFTYRRINDKEASKKLIHSAFTHIWKKRLTLDITDDLQLYLVALVKDAILDYYKHKKVSPAYLASFNAYLKSRENAPVQLTRYMNLSDLIEQEIEALPESMRAAYLSVQHHTITPHDNSFLQTRYKQVKKM